jgi:NAD(P) transhydrogenase subunit alpha
LGLSIGVLKEKFPGERRVAITPKVIDMLTKLSAQVVVETGAGLEAGFSDEDYIARGAKIAPNATGVAETVPILGTVRVPEPDSLVRKGQIVIGFADPLSDPQLALRYARVGATLFSMELIPRITRAQSMDALSSMASIAGYKAVLLAASALPFQ